MQPLKISDEFKRKLAAEMEGRQEIKPETSNPGNLVELVPGLQSSRFLLNHKFPKEDPIIAGLLKKNETVLLVGKPKMGKSRLIYQAAICLSSGIEFLGNTVPLKKRVLYLALEDGPETTQERLRAIGGEQALTDNLILYAPKNLNENRADLSRGGAIFLKQIIAKVSPDVLIIDPLRVFCGHKFDERKSEDVLKFYIFMATLKKEFPGLAVILVHHCRKADPRYSASLKTDPHAWVQNTSGSFSLVAHAETTLGFDRELQPDGSELIVFNGVARNYRVPLMFLDDCENLSFRRIIGEELATSAMSEKERLAWAAAKSLRLFRLDQLENESKIPMRILLGMIKKAQAAGVLDYVAGKYFISGKSEGNNNCSLHVE